MKSIMKIANINKRSMEKDTVIMESFLNKIPYRTAVGCNMSCMLACRKVVMWVGKIVRCGLTLLIYRNFIKEHRIVFWDKIILRP